MIDKLENIGFYTLSDARAKQASPKSPLHRCELILTDACNFKCPYCRKNIPGTISLDQAKKVVDIWAKNKVKNVRFSGGEPTIWKPLLDLVKYTKKIKTIKHIAISTNGSADFSFYKKLIDARVNDFSISLDACCASAGNKMAGVAGVWDKVVDNIRKISKLCYTTVGIVVTEETLGSLNDIIKFADSLGVSDIRIISSAQFNGLLETVKNLDEKIVNKYPILKYRINNTKNGINVRGMSEFDYRKCALVLDDMAVANGKHYPCIIYLREKGKEIGKMSGNIRKEREEWFKNHNCYEDEICRKNCLDVCKDYVQKYWEFKKIKLKKMDSSLFTWELWNNGSIHNLIGNEDCRYKLITTEKIKRLIREYAVGWCDSDNLSIRVKENQAAVMFERDDKRFWFHLRSNEFREIFGGE